MTFDDELVLIEKVSSTNEIGDPVTTEIRTSVLCGVRSVRQSEHYAAAAHGLQPEIVFVINQYDYSGQKDVEYSGQKYRVIRTYKADKAKDFSDFENIELVCQGVVNRANA